LALVAAFPVTVSAQSVEGEVLDQRQRPVTGVYVGLFDGERNLVASSTSDGRGLFTVTARETGDYFVYMTRIGYRSLYDGPFELTEGQVLELFAVIHPFPIAVEGLDVDIPIGVVPRLKAVGFYERKARGFGHFIEREDIEKYEHGFLTDILRRVPRVDVSDRAPTGTSFRDLRSPELVFTAGGRYCVPAAFMDGVMVSAGGRFATATLYPDDHARPSDVEAIEVYTSPAQSPTQYQPIGGCGVLLIWTRHARTGAGVGP
jgi:hypothetical protein